MNSIARGLDTRNNARHTILNELHAMQSAETQGMENPSNSDAACFGNVLLTTVKSQCDQTWPVCKACERKNIQCPGPSSLLKFVYGGPRADHKSSRVEPFYQGTVSASDVDAPAGIKEKRKAVFTGRGSSRRVHGYQSAFRLAPRPVPTSQAERIGSQLVDHLQSRPITDMVLMGFLPDLPRYLPRSKTLQDSVSLLCLLWTNCRRGIPAVLSVDMPEYGKAIGSLRRTLERSKKMTLQTLASAAILGRLEYSFLPSSGLMRFGVHPRGISIMTQQLGPPGRDDVVYAAILRETYKVLVCGRPFIYAEFSDLTST